MLRGSGQSGRGVSRRNALPVHLFQENIRYDKVGEALGAHGGYVTKPAEFRPAIERAWQIAVKERRPSVINCQGRKECDRPASRVCGADYLSEAFGLPVE